jgi:Carboxypeptidase regulatory-like domain
VRVDWRWPVLVAVSATLALCAWPLALRANTCIAPKPLKHSGAVCGRVFDPSGAVVAGVDLQLLNDAGAVAGQAHADSNGNFAFALLPKGKYRLATSTPGWVITFGDIEITGGEAKCKPLTVTLGIHACDGGVSAKKPPRATFTGPRSAALATSEKNAEAD